MRMLELPGVTLIAADTANHALALRALAKSREGIRYGRTLFLTDAVPAHIAVPDGIEVVRIAPLASRDAYSQFVLKSLAAHVSTSHVLLVQWDGYVVNPAAWDPAFLDCDYIGAKWYWYEDDLRVGNGGFSLRSRKLLDALQDPRIVLAEAEDLTIGRTFRRLLENEHGVRFGSEALADRFAFEVAYPIGKPFGFHGLFNFCRTVPPAKIAALAPQFSDTIAHSPQLLALLRNCMALGQWDAVIAIARRMLATTPDHPEAAAMLANGERNAAQPAAVGRNEPCPCGSGRKYKQCHGALGREAVPAAAAGSPADADRQVRDGMMAHQRGDLDAAERAYRAALATLATHPVATHYLGVVLYQRGQLADALPLLEQGAAAVPQEPEFHNNVGLALAAADREDEAIAAYRRTLALKPDHAVAWNNLGLALQAGNRLPDAIAAFREALALAPDFAQAHWNIALALLAHGDFAAGWHEYEWRFRIPDLARHERQYAGVRWDGVLRSGQTLLVTAEQGLGDTLQFIRLVRFVAARGARVVVSAPRPLVHLLATAPGVSAVYAPDDVLPAYDAYTPVIALAGILGVTTETIPDAVPYLAADAERRAEISRASAGDPGLKVGLAWSGSRLNTNDRRRSIALSTLAPLFALSGVSWYSLQREEDEADIARVTAARVLHRLPARNDFDGTAALVDMLDLVVSVDTSLVHLAGALARPTWVMLPFASDWRWRLERTDSQWYPTARLFRQSRVGDWDAVVARVSNEIGLLPARPVPAA